MTSRRAGTVLVVLVLALVLGGPTAASAHPLGNFTVNRYARVELSAGTARVLYVLDLAEVPSFQVRGEVSADPDGFAARQVEDISDGLTLEVDGTALDLRAVGRELTQPDGQGGLPTTRLVVLFEAPLPPGEPDAIRDGVFRDDNGTDRIGWREVLVTAPGDGEVVTSSVPEADISDELTDYPEDRLQSPLDVREASFRFEAGTDEVEVPPLSGARSASVRSDRFTDLLDREDVTPLVLAGMLAVAVVVGVGHALAPGHGKTVMAAYLIGTRGRPVDAVLLGVIVSAMHTASVLLLGVALHQLDERFALDRVYPVLTLASGFGVLVVGAWLATTRLRTLRRSEGRIGTPDLVHVPVALDVAVPVGVGTGVTGAVALRAPTDDVAVDHHGDGGDDDHEHEHGGHEHEHGGHGHGDHGHGDHGHGHDDHGHDDHGHDDHGHDDHDQGDHGHGHGGHGHDQGDRVDGDLGHGDLDVHTHADGARDDGHGHSHHGHGDHHHDHGDHDHHHGPSDLPGQDRGALADGRRAGATPVAHAAGHRHGWGGAGHGHDHGPGGHSHDLPEGVAPLSRRGLVLLATAGGIVPSPSAVIVLVSAFTLGRVGLGLALVAAFSVGLAATLTAVGLALVYGSRSLGDHVSERLVRVFPVAGAVALLVLGAVLTVQGARGI